MGKSSDFEFSGADIRTIQTLMDGLEDIPVKGIELMHKTEDGVRIRILKDRNGKYWLYDIKKHARKIENPSDVALSIRNL